MIQLCVRKIDASAAATPTDAGVAAAVAVVEQRSVVALTVVETAVGEAPGSLMVE